MSVMDRFARLDSALQRGLDNTFARVFGGRVVPPEIEELLKQEARDNLVATEDDRLAAPNVYMVGVSSKDLLNLAEGNPQLPVSFADQMSRYCRNQAWTLAGPVVVHIAEESGLRTGQLRVSSYIDPSPVDQSGFEAINPEDLQNRTDSDANSDSTPAKPAEPAPQASPASPAPAPPPPPPPAPPVPVPTPEPAAASEPHQEPEADPGATTHLSPATDSQEENMNAKSPADVDQQLTVNLLLQDGSSRTYLVREGSNVIGRSNDADFRLPDTGVSRQHAEVTWDGRDAILVDLRSTNGTTVNDTPVENWLLADGDVITIGHSHIEVRIIDPSQR